jgi:hypothetical protein
MIVYSHWIQRRRDIPPPALSRDSGNRDRAAHPDRHASVGPATAKKSSIETFAVAMGLEQTAIPGDTNACSQSALAIRDGVS